MFFRKNELFSTSAGFQQDRLFVHDFFNVPKFNLQIDIRNIKIKFVDGINPLKSASKWRSFKKIAGFSIFTR